MAYNVNAVINQVEENKMPHELPSRVEQQIIVADVHSQAPPNGQIILNNSDESDNFQFYNTQQAMEEDHRELLLEEPTPQAEVLSEKRKAGSRRKTSQSSTSAQPKSILTVNLPSKNEKLLPKIEEASHAPSRVVIFCKWIVMIFTFLLFLACLVFSKLSFIHLTSALKGANTNSVFLMILISIMMPYALTLLKSSWCGGLRNDRPWPSKKALAWGVASAVSESSGISLFAFGVLPDSPGYIGILLMNGVFFMPIILQIAFSIRRHRRGITSESRVATVILVIALVTSLVGLALTVAFVFKLKPPMKNLWAIPVSIILLSFAWCPLVQKLQLDPSEAALRELVNKDETTRNDQPVDPGASRSTARTVSSAGSINSNTSTASTGSSWSRQNDLDTNSIRNKEKDPTELPLAWAHPQFSARWKISMITAFIKMILIPSFALLYGRFIRKIDIGQLQNGFAGIHMGTDSFVCFMISIFTSFGGYMLGWAACVMGIHRVAFTAPLLLGTPLTVAAVMIKVTCHAIFRHADDAMCSHNYSHDITLPAACCLYVSQLLSVGYFLFKTVNIVMPKESQIFWLPGYNSVFLEQHLLLNRKNKQTDASYVHPAARALKSKVFICTTMYREAAHEMEQLLKSYARINWAKQESDRNFQAHVFLDNGTRDSRLTPFALQLISLVKKTLGVFMEDCTKSNTPYGRSLSWRLPSAQEGKLGMEFTIHLKDNRKVKNKKRWSQIMYMSYIMDFLVKEDEAANYQDSYILTTDADIRFAPDSVEALLDLMISDANVGAVCSRTHPLGSGPVYWYQIFDYAIGHWLQKVANHVLGSVLCCPGCFSVYRVKALRDVVSTYASSVTRASEFLTKDMGEDRWLCTLMVQAGWRLEYCAAGENSTYCPEEFDEYFKQRRRWIPSSLANQVLLMQEWQTMFHFNKQISVFFIVYQGILLISALLNPSMVIIIIVGGLDYSVGLPSSLSAVVMILITLGYTWICLSWSQEWQLKIAKVLTIFFALVMAAAIIGLAVQLVGEATGKNTDLTTAAPTKTPYTPPKPVHHTTNKGDHVFGLVDGDVTMRYGPKHRLWMDRTVGYDVTTSNDDVIINPIGYRNKQRRHKRRNPSENALLDLSENISPTPPVDTTTEVPSEKIPFSVSSLYFYSLVVAYVVTAFLHPGEAYCVVHGVWYLLCLPAGSLVLMIYSICNITDRSWGTREEKKATGFVKTTNWTETMRNAMKKVFFCCSPNEPPHPQTQHSNDEVKTEKDDKKEQSDANKKDEETRSESKMKKFTRKKLERSRSSFRFNADGAENRPVPVLDWLPSNLAHLYGLHFIENGYEDTSFVAGMSEADIRAIGITSRPHINGILFDIGRLPELDIEPCVPEHVDDWLESIGLSMYKLNFRRSFIITRTHLEILRAMTKEDIEKELNITKPGHLRRIKIAIANLRYPTEAEKEMAEVKIQLDGLHTFDMEHSDPRQHEFWEDLRQNCLLPESVAFAHDLDLKEKLTELRNSVLMAFAVANALFLITMLVLFTKDTLNVYNENAIGTCFAFIFGMVLILQFLTMIVHRVSTWMHMIARAPMKCGDPYNASWAWTNQGIAKIEGDENEDKHSIETSAEAEALNFKRQGVEEARRRNRNSTRKNLGHIEEEDVHFDGSAPLIPPV